MRQKYEALVKHVDTSGKLYTLFQDENSSARQLFLQRPANQAQDRLHLHMVPQCRQAHDGQLQPMEGAAIVPRFFPFIFFY